MPLLSLPTELLHQIASNLDFRKDLNALLSTNRRLYEIFNLSLYRDQIHAEGPFTVLIFAAQMGHVQTVQRILQISAEEPEPSKIQLSPNGPGMDERGLTFFWPPLVWAAVKGDGAMIELLLGMENVNVNCKCPAGRTPLSYAAEQGHIGAARLLLAAGADPNCRDSDGRTALHWAGSPRWTDFSDSVVTVMEFGCLVREQGTPIFCPVEVLFEQGKPPSYGWRDVEVSTEACNCKGVKSKDDFLPSCFSVTTEWSAGRCYQGVLRLLLQYGADLEIRDSSHHTPLTWAVACGYQPLVELLAECGAALEPTESRCPSPLSTAAGYGRIPIVRYLLNRGVTVDSDHSNMGMSPLSCAAMNGHDEIVAILLKHTVERETRFGSDEWQPLICAARNGHTTTVANLLSAHARMWPDLPIGYMAAFWAAHNGHTGVIELLLAAGAEVDICPEIFNRMSCVHLAVMNDHLDTVKFLLDTERIDINIKDSRGWTAFTYAQMRLEKATKHTSRCAKAMIKVLLDYGADPALSNVDFSSALFQLPYFPVQHDSGCSFFTPPTWPISFRCDWAALAQGKRGPTNMVSEEVAWRKWQARFEGWDYSCFETN